MREDGRQPFLLPSTFPALPPPPDFLIRQSGSHSSHCSPQTATETPPQLLGSPWMLASLDCGEGREAGGGGGRTTFQMLLFNPHHSPARTRVSAPTSQM